jgi:hypothetical protein
LVEASAVIILRLLVWINLLFLFDG